MPVDAPPLAVVTGASTGIGSELALARARDGFDLMIAAHEATTTQAADAFRAVRVHPDRAARSGSG